MPPSKQLRKLFAEGYQLTPEAFDYLNSLDEIESIVKKIISSGTEKIILSVEDISGLMEVETVVKEKKRIEKESEKLEVEEDVKEAQEKVQYESQAVEIKDKTKSIEDKLMEKISQKPVTRIREEKISSDLEIISSPKIEKIPATAESFRKYFENRYETIKSFFSRRRDITNRVAVSDLQTNKDRDKVSLIAIVTKIQRTRKGNVILDLEDLTGGITCLIHSSNPDLVYKSEFILEDSVLCFTGDWKRDRMFIHDVQWPDIPYTHKPNYAHEDVLSLFVSDIHVGSKNFAGELFLRVINLLNGRLENEKYNEIGRKTKYLFVGGDVVDGVGVYPGQHDDLVLDNINLQYLLAAEYFDQIRKDVEIVIIPGNHDAARASEPQTPIQKEFAPELYELDNVHLLGSPCYLRAHNVEILMNHGNSILDINAAIPAIPHETSIPAMVEMLKNRHLVPIYGKRTPIAPEPVDQLIISKPPDIFQTGHTHIAGDETYKGVTLINSGTFQYQTDYQRSMNINPTTGSTYIINLKNLQRTPLKFQEIK